MAYSENEAERIYEEICILRKEDKKFDNLVSEIETKIENFISEKESLRSFRPKSISSYRLSIKVAAVPITEKQKGTLESYLDSHYIPKVGGLYFEISKCLFSKNYRIKRHELDESIFFDDCW